MSQENWPRTVCPSNVTVFGIGNKIKSQFRKVGQNFDERTTEHGAGWYHPVSEVGESRVTSTSRCRYKWGGVTVAAGFCVDSKQG
jgi:hypothetical protein